MTPVTILHEAEIELWEAVLFYENRCAGLGLDFEREIEAAVELIQQSPGRWPPQKDGTQVLDPPLPVLRRLCHARRPCVDHRLCPLQKETRILVWPHEEGRTPTRTAT